MKYGYERSSDMVQVKFVEGGECPKVSSRDTPVFVGGSSAGRKCQGYDNS